MVLLVVLWVRYLLYGLFFLKWLSVAVRCTFCGIFYFFSQFHMSYLLFSCIINFLRKSPRESPGARAGAWTLWQHHVQEPATPPLQHVHLCWYGCRDVETPSAPAFRRQALSLHRVACIIVHNPVSSPCSFVLQIVCWQIASFML